MIEGPSDSGVISIGYINVTRPEVYWFMIYLNSFTRTISLKHYVHSRTVLAMIGGSFYPHMDTNVCD